MLGPRPTNVLTGDSFFQTYSHPHHSIEPFSECYGHGRNGRPRAEISIIDNFKANTYFFLYSGNIEELSGPPDVLDSDKTSFLAQNGVYQKATSRA